jgi:RND family efflux transporter MFP subunit
MLLMIISKLAIRNRYGLTAALLVLITVWGCQKADQASNEKSIVRPAKIVEIADPSKELNRVFPGVVEAGDDAKLSFRVRGELVSLPAIGKIGKFVDEGELLAQIDARDFEIVLSDAKAAADLAEANYRRAKRLIDKGYISRLQFDQAEANVKSTRARLDRARADIRYTRLVAPFRARIAQVLVKNYESVRVNQPIVILETSDNLDVEIQVPNSLVAIIPEEAKARFRAGQRGENVLSVTFEGVPGKYPAFVKEWETRPDPDTLTYRLVVTAKPPQGQEILPGADAKVYLDLVKLGAVDPLIFVPPGAVFAAEDQPLASQERYVWKLNPETMTVSRHPVQIGELTPNGLIITKGLAAGDKIVAAGVHFLTEGTRVRELSREEGL